MESHSFFVLLNKYFDSRLALYFISFYPSLWDTRKRVWQFADNSRMLLDVGCRWAYYTRSSNAKTVVGIDLNRQVLQQAYLYGKGKKFFAIICDAAHLPLAQESFDTIICIEVLEHIVDDDLAVREMHRVLKRGGKALLTTPNGECLSPSLPRYHEHVRHYRGAEIVSLFNKYFSFVKVNGRLDLAYTTYTCLSEVRYTLLRIIALILFSPIINLITWLENKRKIGRYNLVIKVQKS